MKGRDEIKELFSEKLGNYEAKVNPELWTNIASQIGAATATTAASTGISLLTKWIIGASIASAVAVTTIIVVNNADEPVSNEIPNTENVAENTSSIEDNQIFEDKKINKTNDVEQISTPNEKVKLKKEKENDVLLTKVKVTKHDDTPPIEPNKPPVAEKNPKEAIESVEKDKMVITVPFEKDPIARKNEPVIEDVEFDEQTPEEDELNYKIGELRNVFTPNGDGVNDLFFIESEGLSDFNIVVLDVKNQVVFQSNNAGFKWDGNDLSGSPLPANRYIYFITAKDKNGTFIKKGNGLTIKR